ncbi:uncharacterized protein LOC124940286 isoform X2 [Impatiens glandulifera]|nr:uncharacterized protein LOC124940286 isoform X2 [Impatiens glandulifera]
MESTTHVLSEEEHYLFGDPRISPRVGDNYQVEIPSLLSDFEYDSYVKNPIKEDFKSNLVPSDFLVGLPVSVMWIDDDKNMGKHIQEGVNVKETDRKMENCCLVPGEAGDSLNDVEEAGFILGLYVFGKNLVQVKRLVENKTMGTILSFYYGKFYRSNGYRRWSEGRKTRTRKFVQGHRIFSGFRQQELLSRLSAFVSEEDRNRLSQVSKSCSEGKSSLEEYITILKSTVGMKNLVEAVGIGKGKQDLTRTSLEPSKSNSYNNNRSEATAPFGKSCSSLTPAEIVNFLTGDIRLSKAKTNDLFWESVWPRLLARGWQSEQPKDYNYAATFKNTLVFLMPGIMKFSRRSLVKGNDYFDCITDVLNKVASDPTLIDLDDEIDENNRKNNDLPDKEHRCYLQPRLMSQNVETMKFMVVDTSMAHGKPFKVRELRTDEESSGISSEDTNSADTNSSKTGKKKHEETSLIQPKKRSNQPKEGNSDRKIGKVRKRKKLTSCNNRGMELDNNKIHLPANSLENGETSKVFIDLNVAQPPPLLDCGTNEVVITTIKENSIEQQCGEIKKDTTDVITTTTNITEEQNNTNSRRHGTRNRNPTMRSLEALANGFLTVNSKKKDSKAAAARPKKQNSNNIGNADKNVELEDAGSCSNGGVSRKFFALNESSPRD